MSVQIACPKCQKKLKIEDNLLGKNIKCPACAAVFAVKAPASSTTAAAPPPARTDPEPPRKAAPPPDDDEDEAPRRPEKAAPKAMDDDEDDRPAKPAAKKSRDDDDDYDDRPKKSSAKKAQDDDEDDRPKKAAAKKGRDDDDDDRPKKSAAKKGRDWGDDDDDDRPSKKEKKKGSGGKVLLIVGTLVLLLCGGCFGVGYYIYVKIGEGVDVVRGAMTDIESKMTAKDSKEPLAGPKPVTFPRGWKDFNPDKYGFLVMLPGTPVADSTNDAAHGVFTLEVPPGQPLGPTKSGYWVTEKEVPGADQFGMIEPNLDSLVTLGATQMGLGGKVVNKKSGTFAGKPGRAWDVETGDGVWHFRACLSGTKAYTLAAGPEAKVPAADANIFFASFELVPPVTGKGENPKPQPTGKGEKPNPPDQPKLATEQQLADAMVDNSEAAMKLYVPQPLQLTGVVTRVTTGPRTRVNEIFFEPLVQDPKTKQKIKFPINCRLAQVVTLAKATVGATVTVRGNLTGGGKDSATLNDCVVVSTKPAKPGAGNDPAKPNDQFPVVSPEDLANDLNENQQAAYNRYFGKPLKIDGGVVSKQEKNPDGSISAVVFEVQVKDKKTGAMKPFLITCKLGSPISARRTGCRTLRHREDRHRPWQTGSSHLHRQEGDSYRLCFRQSGTGALIVTLQTYARSNRCNNRSRTAVSGISSEEGRPIPNQQGTVGGLRRAQSMTSLHQRSIERNHSRTGCGSRASSASSRHAARPFGAHSLGSKNNSHGS